MIVCHCHGVSDRVIRAAAGLGGARDTESVGDLCGAGTSCGGCAPAIRDLLATLGLCTHEVVAAATSAA